MLAAPINAAAKAARNAAQPCSLLKTNHSTGTGATSATSHNRPGPGATVPASPIERNIKTPLETAHNQGVRRCMGLSLRSR